MSKRITCNEFLERKKETGRLDHINVLEEYTGHKNKLKCFCTRHSIEFYTTPETLLSSHGCKKCGNEETTKAKLLSQDEYVKKANIKNPMIKVIGDYLGSYKEITVECCDCHKVWNVKRAIYLIIKVKKCPYCSDAISFPNKLMFNILNDLHIDFDNEVNFDWCKFYLNGEQRQGRYDFVLSSSSNKYIIEMDGSFHEKPHGYSVFSKEDIKLIDSIKDNLAYLNNYVMIRINCSNVDFDAIKTEIYKSELRSILDLDLVDWRLCYINSLRSRLIEACELWNRKLSTTEISNILKISIRTTINYLKRGARLTLCDYSSSKSRWQTLEKQRLKCVCLNTKEVFNSITIAARKYNTFKTSISACCKNMSKYAGKHPITNENLHWEYYDEIKHCNFFAA